MLTCSGCGSASRYRGGSGAMAEPTLFKFHVANRPWILLKWAASLDGFLGAKTNDPVGRRVSGSEAHRLVHRWRSEESAIAVGSATALNDNPQLTVREWPGRSPVRILFDRTGRVQGDLHLFDGSVRTIRFSQKIVGPTAGMEEIRLEEGSHFIVMPLPACMISVCSLYWLKADQ